MSDLLNQASLVMVPSGYKEDTVYSVVPTDGSGDLSFTRASNGTRVNSAGLVEVCPWNLLQYSETFDNGYWNKGGASITANATTAPNGTTTADKFIESATLDTHQLYVTFVGNTGVSTLFIYAKKAERSAIQITSDQATDPSAIFNLDTGVIYSSANCTPFIESVGNGWYKCGITYTIDQTTSYPVFRVVDSSFNVVYTGNGTSGIYIWGAQLNIGSTAKPYFPTTDRLNVPRLTYQNGGGGCPSLLLEPQRTNLFLSSQQFTSASWLTGGGGAAVFTDNFAISPDGTTNAARWTAAGTNYQTRQNVATINTTATLSVWMRSNSGTKSVTLFINDTTVTSTISVTTTWQRFSVTGAVGATLVGAGRCGFSNNSILTNTDYIEVFGAQYEVGAYPTTYIPTTSSSATRVADACSKTGISSLIGSSEGTLFVDFVKSQDGYNYYNLSDGTNNNRIFVGQDADAPNRLRAYIREGGNTASVDINVGPVANGRYKMAIGYKLNDVVFYINGTLSGTDTSTLMPTGLSDLSLTNLTGGSASVITHTNQVALFKTRLTNAELASLTTI